MLSRIKNFLLTYPVVFVLLGSFCLYLPSLPVPFRDPDHLVYFANLGPGHSLWDGLRHVDYSFSRIYWKGDDFLFRPLLFVLLAVQTAVFSAQYLWWNLTNLSLHILVLWSFYRLLTVISGERLFAAAFCGLFAFSRAPFGLATNPHLGGYLAGFFFFFTALRFIYPGSATQDINLRIYALCAAVSFFFYELTIPFLAAAALIFYGTHRQTLTIRKTSLLFLPFAVYAAAYVPHALLVKRLLYASSVETPGIFDVQNLRALPWNAYYLFHEFFRDVFPDLLRDKVLLILPFFAVVFPAFFSTRPPLWMRFYPCLLIVLYCAGLGFFRNTFARDYYQYLFHLFLPLAVYSQIDFKKLASFRKRLVFIYLLAVILVVTPLVGKMLWNLKNDYALSHVYYQFINRFVSTHKNEPDFSFRIANPHRDLDMDCKLKEGYPDEGTDADVFSRKFTEVLYAPYYRNTHPRYELRWTGKTFMTERGSS